MVARQSLVLHVLLIGATGCAIQLKAPSASGDGLSDDATTGTISLDTGLTDDVPEGALDDAPEDPAEDPSDDPAPTEFETVVEGPLTLHSEADMLALCAVTAVVDGDLTIQANDVRDLTALDCLQEVRGDLVLHSSSLVTTAGLDTLAAVGGSIHITAAPALSRVEGFSNLERVGGTLDLSRARDQQPLEFIDRFDALHTIGTLLVTGNDLTTAPEFPALRTVTSALRLESLPDRAVPQFPALTHVESLTYTRVRSESPPRFESLLNVGESVVIAHNTFLERIPGFDHVAYIPSLEVTANPRLQAISGLSNLAIVDTLDIELNDTDRSVGWLRALRRVTGDATISAEPGTMPALPSLSQVGTLHADGVAADTLTWLPALEVVDGTASFFPALAPGHFGGPPNLAHVGGDLVFYGQPISISQFPALEQVGGSIELLASPRLTSVALDALVNVGGDLIVEDCRELHTLHLPNLQSVDGSFRLVADRYLEDAALPPSLQHVGGDFILNRLNSIRTFDHLTSLTTVDGDFDITDVQKLTDPYGLSALTSVGGNARAGGHIWIGEAELQWLEDTLTHVASGTVTVTP